MIKEVPDYKKNKINKKKAQKKNHNNTYLYIIIFLIIVIFIETSYILFDIFILNKNKDLDTTSSKMTPKQLIEYFENKDYYIIMGHNDKNVLTLTIFSNSDNIQFSKIIDNSTLDVSLIFNNWNINDEIVNVLDNSEITNSNKIDQLNSYKNWLNDNKVTQEQLSEMLDFYYENNPEEVIYTNSDE